MIIKSSLTLILVVFALWGISSYQELELLSCDLTWSLKIRGISIFQKWLNCEFLSVLILRRRKISHYLAFLMRIYNFLCLFEGFIAFQMLSILNIFNLIQGWGQHFSEISKIQKFWIISGWGQNKGAQCPS